MPNLPLLPNVVYRLSLLMLKSALTMLLSLASLSVVAATIQGVRIHESPDATRIVLDTSGAVKVQVLQLR